MAGKNRSSQNTRSLILEMAANIIREQGLRSLKMKTLSDRTGRSRWTIYNHFGSINDIKGELYQRSDFISTHLNKIVALFVNGPQPAQTGVLAQLLSQHFDHLMKDTLYREFAVAEFLGTEPIISQMISLREQRIAEIVRSLRQDDGYCPEFPLGFLFPVLFGGITFLAFSYRVNGSASYFGAKYLEKETLIKFLENMIRLSTEHGKGISKEKFLESYGPMSITTFQGLQHGR